MAAGGRGAWYIRETVLEEGAELLQNGSACCFRGEQDQAVVLHDGLERFQVDENGPVPHQKACQLVRKGNVDCPQVPLSRRPSVSTRPFTHEHHPPPHNPHLKAKRNQQMNEKDVLAAL